MAAGGGTKAVIAAMVANAGIAVAKFVAFVVTGSASMLAEGIHSVADTSNQALLLLGGARARRDATPEHPFGYGRERYFWSFVVALVLFSLGGLFALFEGYEKLRHPHGLESPAWAISVLVVAIALESWSFRTAIVESNAVRGSRSWTQFVRHAKAPELPVVLLEDAGAMIGLILALVGVSLAVLTGDPTWDALGTLTIGVLLVVIAAVLAVEMKSLLIGEAAGPADRAALLAALVGAPQVLRVIHLRSQHLGPDELLVGAKVEFAATLSLTQVTEAIDAAERAMREAVPAARIIYLEPDAYESDHRPTPDRPAG
jgi:cation diffusion facilitator family transporter